MSQNYILPFLTGLQQHNDRSWLLEHKELQRQATDQFHELLQQLILLLGEQDPSVAHLTPKELTFRLNRDTRFSADKSPYNPSFRAHIAPAGKAPIPVGYFLHLAPGNIFLGGGLFAWQFTDATAMIRDYICAHGEEFESIVTDPAFTADFALIGQQLQKVPRGYDPDFAQSRFLKYKSWAVEYHLDDSVLQDPAAFCRLATEKFLRMRPFNQFLNRALADFTMPQR